MEEIQVPPYFICPISLEMMKDPVTISTGITYDRENIEKWIFSAKNNSCPATKQSLTCIELTPNVTLRRLIQSWCTINASHGIERFPTPKPPVSKPQIIKLLKEAKSPKMLMNSLKRLRSIASENDANKRCMESAGAMEFLASIINNNNNLNEVFEEEEGFMSTKDEALSILYQLKLSENGLRSLIMSGNGEFIESLTLVMQHGSYESRAYAVMLMKDMFEVSTPTLLLSLKQEFFTQVVQVLRDEISQKAMKASLQVLVNACPFGRNRVKAAEAGAIRVLVDLLLDSSEKRVCEFMLVLLDQICQSAEGRAELLNHPGGLAIVSKKILRVSKVGSERAIKILHSISKFSSTPSVVQEMLSLGVVAKLCLVLQVDCGSKEMMKDPVTISTGITYDRENIEKWIFSAKNNTCPATKQSLTCIELTPNVTLRRFIQSWCTINASHGIERFPTPKPPVSKPQIIKLLKEAKSPKMQMKSLKRLRSIASENDANKRCMESAGAMEFLASIINNNNNLNEVFEEEEGFMSTKDEALSILYQLKLSENGLRSLIMSGNGEFIESLTLVMQHGSYESRAYAVMLMKDMFEVSTPTLLLSLKQEFFTQVVQVLRDEISQKAMKASLQVLVYACPFGRSSESGEASN
ncbi:hypothetical protein H5410_000381 [Solanum commersonii]|uniref:U-box domain-containing protein n=1 Tax=Solanum commersonii TaxID=4109 RepID=A0A9J6AVZ6_SOLCO|nr:hypothetical protein H5410_000381 [Solanum commersonii]